MKKNAVSSTTQSPALGFTLGLALLVAAAAPAWAAPAFVHGPYQDVSLDITAATPRIARVAWTAPGQTLTWAFATGACKHERWGDFDTATFARLNVADALQRQQPYIVSTGGEAGVFTCASDADMLAFVARYASPMLVGLDFDVEGKQTPRQIGELVRSVAAVHHAHPALRLSFTLATHASADGSLRSLNATGEATLAALAAERLDAAIINLMVMNYGTPDARWCVLREGAEPAACDMGRSALQAVHNVHQKYGVPFAQIAVTAMPGENDVAGNVFTLDDAQRLAAGARQLGLAGVHYWSVTRDQSCAAGSPRVSARCHSLPGLAPGRFGQVLAAPGK